MLQWSISRIFLHTGDFHLEHIEESDLAEFTEALHWFGERPDLPLFFGSAEQYWKQAKSYLACLHRLHVILYHRGRTYTL